ncbi:hypothetical protein HDK77DRAFT_10069 [Phyllosticta capitalensis]|uniref:Uncharacterized protein n=1 Tax=Phyllosticta capitalensis TaxID=121624 RepID=A0ABR1YYL6_9PEZI
MTDNLQSSQPSSSRNDSQASEPTLMPFNVSCHVVSIVQCRCYWCVGPRTSPVVPASNVEAEPESTTQENDANNPADSNSRPSNRTGVNRNRSLRPRRHSRPIRLSTEPNHRLPSRSGRNVRSEREVGLEGDPHPELRVYIGFIVQLRCRICQALLPNQGQNYDPAWWNTLGEARDDYWNEEAYVPGDVLEEVNDGASETNSLASTAVGSLTAIAEDGLINRPPSQVIEERPPLDPVDHAFDVGPYIAEPGDGDFYRSRPVDSPNAGVMHRGSTRSLRPEPATSDRQTVSSGDEESQESADEEGTLFSVSVSTNPAEPATSDHEIVISEIPPASQPDTPAEEEDILIHRPWDRGHEHPESRRVVAPQTAESTEVLEGEIIAERGRTLSVINEGNENSNENSNDAARRRSLGRLNGPWLPNWAGWARSSIDAARRDTEIVRAPLPQCPRDDDRRASRVSPTSYPRNAPHPPPIAPLPPPAVVAVAVVAEEPQEQRRRSRRPRLRHIAHGIRRGFRDAMKALTRRGG